MRYKRVALLHGIERKREAPLTLARITGFLLVNIKSILIGLEAAFQDEKVLMDNF